MRRRARILPSSLRRLAAVAAACALWAAGSLSGCAGGTSTEVGNPLTLQFRSQGKPVAFTGFLRLMAAGSNPEFYYDRPDDGTTPPPEIVLSSGAGFGPSALQVPGLTSVTLERQDLVGNLFPRGQLRLSKAAAGTAARRDSGLADFNVILQSAGPGDSLGGWLATVHAEKDGYRTAAGDSGSEFWVDLTPGHRCTGEVDTASAAGKPLALFVPGSPYYALVHAGRFEFVGLPAGRLPLRWVDTQGRVYAVPESLGLAGAGETPAAYSLPGPVHAGARIDSLVLPPPPPTLAPPVAAPIGQYAFSDSVTVTLTAASGATIYYTLDGATPDQGSNKYEKPIVLRASATLKAVAYAPGFKPSPITVNNYVLAPARPSISPAGGTFVDSVRVEITGPAGAAIRYTLDGAAPADTSPLYAGPFVLRASALVQAIALVPGLAPSAAVSSQYVIIPDSARAPAKP